MSKIIVHSYEALSDTFDEVFERMNTGGVSNHVIRARWHDLSRHYLAGRTKPHYQVPAIPTRVEYINGYGLADGVFVRVDDYIVCGAYKDGMIVSGYPSIPYEYDYPDTD